MPRFILVATSSAKEGRDAEYNEWYDEEHMHALLSIPGIISGRRFEASPASPHPAPARYLGIFEIEADDPAEIMAELVRRGASGEISATDSLDGSSVQLWIWREL